jgi:hypothetical protein
MDARATLRRIVLVTLLSTFVVVLLAATAVAGAKPNPAAQPKHDNPFAALQQVVDALAAQVASLDSQVAALRAEVAALGTAQTLAVYDAAGKKVGPVAGVQDGVPWVAFTATGHTFVLQAFAGQLVGEVLWYTGPECSGDPYISDVALDRGAVFAVAAVQEPGGVVYAAALDATVRTVDVQSVRERDGRCWSYDWTFPYSVLPVTPVLTLDAVFTRPYSVR